MRNFVHLFDRLYTTHQYSYELIIRRPLTLIRSLHIMLPLPSPNKCNIQKLTTPQRIPQAVIGQILLYTSNLAINIPFGILESEIHVWSPHRTMIMLHSPLLKNQLRVKHRAPYNPRAATEKSWSLLCTSTPWVYLTTPLQKDQNDQPRTPFSKPSQLHQMIGSPKFDQSHR